MYISRSSAESSSNHLLPASFVRVASEAGGDEIVSIDQRGVGAGGGCGRVARVDVFLVRPAHRAQQRHVQNVPIPVDARVQNLRLRLVQIWQ